MFSIGWMCVSSDPQSSRARKLCVTMEPALLLKGDILVGKKYNYNELLSYNNNNNCNLALVEPIENFLTHLSV